jgi:8-oxo-dGTP pyrophosphatase MutT (NUDIX family)
VTEERHEEKLARWMKHGKRSPEPLAAATVIPVRDGEQGLEALMLRRNSKIAFGGMWVFPGGRGLRFGSDVLLPYSHWTPPPVAPRRYLTWFFLAPAPGGDVVVDGGEIREHCWIRPADALERQGAGEIELAPPTWVTLHELAQRQSVAEGLAVIRSREPERFETRIAVEPEGPTALWHGDAGYASGDAGAAGARHRLRMRKGGWSYERTD